MKEYLDPTDWSLKLVNVDNDAARPDWIEVPEGAELLLQLPFAERATGQNIAFYKENFKYAYVPALFRKWGHVNLRKWGHVNRPRKFLETYPVLWRRQKPRVRVYATLSQSKFERDIAMAEAAADWSAPGWREAARKRVLEEWQPDWTQAPEWANWWAMDASGDGNFTEYEPVLSEMIAAWVDSSPLKAPWRVRECSFLNFKGDWRDSLRKRPTTEWQPDWAQAPKGCDWFAVDFDSTGTFMNYEPEMLCGTWVASSSTMHPIIKARPGTNFNYQGDWRDSLRKRGE